MVTNSVEKLAQELFNAGVKHGAGRWDKPNEVFRDIYSLVATDLIEAGWRKHGKEIP